MYIRKAYTDKDFDWTSWTPARITSRSREIIQTLKIHNAYVRAIPRDERTFANTIIDQVPPRTTSDIAAISLLMELSPKKKVRDSAQEALQYLDAQMIDIAYDKGRYEAIKEYMELQSPEKKTLRPADRKLLHDIQKRYERMGFDLSTTTQKKIHTLKKKIIVLQNIFNKRLNDADATLLARKEELEGVPDTCKEGLQKKRGQYVLTLDYPVIGPVLKYARSPLLRKRLADLNNKKGGTKNLAILEKVVSLRQEKARLLGYRHHANYRIEEYMAENADTVMRFLKQLVPVVQKENKKAYATLLRLKKEEGDRGPVHYYDTARYVEKARNAMFAIDQEMMREYFPMERVRDQVFALMGTLYGVRFVPTQLPVWHPDVMIYKVIDTRSKKLLGYCALDLYPRKGKYGHMACANTIQGRELVWDSIEGGYQAPFSVILGNFQPPTKKRPSLLSHSEVVTFFHECGHLIHGLVTEAPFEEQSGTNVAHDFVELPSQMMENWAWDPTILKKMSRHYRTGKALDTKTIDALVASRFYLSSLSSGRLVGLALADIQMHSSPKQQNLPASINVLMYSLTGIVQAKDTLFPASFGHLTGGYDAGYYSYAWALVYAHDCFSVFKKAGIMNQKIGKAFREQILAVGSSRPEMQSLKAFLGRAPSQKPFIETLSVEHTPKTKAKRKK